MLERPPLSRAANYLTGSGLLIALLGLGWDVWIHAREGEALAAEELFAFNNPGHVVFGAGLCLALGGVVLGLLTHPAGASRATRLRDGGLAVVLVLVTSGVLAFGFSTSTTGHSHDSAPAVAQIDIDALDLSEEELFLVEDSRHEEAGLTHEHLSLNAADLAKLGEETVRAAKAAERYHSIDVAIREGYLQITQDLPLIGAHFLRPSLADGVFDLDKPEMLVYSFQDGTWRLYGLSYLSRMIGFDSEPAPVGFTGPYDAWHWHKDWCFTLRGAKAVDAEECKRINGTFVSRTGYMVHFWVVDNPEGVFAHSHPGLVGSKEYIVPGRLPR